MIRNQQHYVCCFELNLEQSVSRVYCLREAVWVLIINEQTFIFRSKHTSHNWFWLPLDTITPGQEVSDQDDLELMVERTDTVDHCLQCMIHRAGFKGLVKLYGIVFGT